MPVTVAALPYNDDLGFSGNTSIGIHEPEQENFCDSLDANDLSMIWEGHQIDTSDFYPKERDIRKKEELV